MSKVDLIPQQNLLEIEDLQLRFQSEKVAVQSLSSSKVPSQFKLIAKSKTKKMITS